MAELSSSSRGLSPSDRDPYSRKWVTKCDGMPSLFGCGSELETTVAIKRPGMKGSGWLICYAKNDDGTDDREMLLAFCPRCVQIMKEAGWLE